MIRAFLTLQITLAHWHFIVADKMAKSSGSPYWRRERNSARSEWMRASGELDLLAINES